MAMTDQLRQAIRDSGLSLQEIQRRSGADHGALSRFRNPRRTLTVPAVEKLCDLLGLALVRVSPGPGAAEDSLAQPAHRVDAGSDSSRRSRAVVPTEPAPARAPRRRKAGGGSPTAPAAPGAPAHGKSKGKGGAGPPHL